MWQGQKDLVSAAASVGPAGAPRCQILPHTNEKSQVPQKRYLTFLAGAEGLGLGYRLGRFAAERHWRSLTPRHALRRAQPCLVAESLCALTKNREASIVLASLFLAGAEGLEPSARGFGVDVGKRRRERGRASVARFSHRTPRRAVLVWCCEDPGEKNYGTDEKQEANAWTISKFSEILLVISGWVLYT